MCVLYCHPCFVLVLVRPSVSLDRVPYYMHTSRRRNLIYLFFGGLWRVVRGRLVFLVLFCMRCLCVSSAFLVRLPVTVSGLSPPPSCLFVDVSLSDAIANNKK